MFDAGDGAVGGLLMSLLVIFLIPSLVISTEAGKKGKSSVGYFFLSLFFTPIFGALALAAAAANPAVQENDALNAGTHRKCPRCAESVKYDAKMCRHCQLDLSAHLEAERIKIKDLIHAQTIPGLIAKETGLSPSALDKRVKYYFGVSNTATALSMAKKGEWK